MSVVGGILIAVGVGLIFTAGIGLLRFPDVFTRANASTKAAGLGVALVLLGVAFLFNTPEAWVKMTIAIVMQFATAPVAGHVIGRAAYRSGAPLWEGTHIDDLAAFERDQPTPTRPSAARDSS